jgi:hypothetical protein
MRNLYSYNDDTIVTEMQQIEIVNWVKNNYMYFKITKPKTFRQHLDLLSDVPQCIWDIKQIIIDKENLSNYKQEPILRDSVGYMINGGTLHKHTDPNPINTNLIHIRFNVYVQLPYEGGIPIYNNKLCSLKERTYICCRSGLDEHYTNKVVGDRERIVLSFGFLIPNEHLPLITYNY